MKRIHKFLPITLGLALCVLTGCYRAHKSPDELLLETAVRQMLGDPKAKVELSSVALTDSTTVKREIQRRRDLFELQLRKNEEFREKYEKAGMLTNARRKKADSDRSKRFLHSIDSLEQTLKGSLDSVIFREYRINGTAKPSEKGADVVAIKDLFVLLRADGTMFAADYNRGNLYKATGKGIPGYSELFDNN